MLKKPLKYYFFSILLIIACAPRVAPPPIYRDVDLSLEEVIFKVGKDIDVLKAVVGINIEKDNEPYSHVDASVLIKRPGWVHMRLYKFGIVVGNFLVKGKVVHVLSGKGSNRSDGELHRNLKELGREIYHSIFWWADMKEGFMYKEGAEYIIRAENKEIHLDRATLLPLKQEIRIGSKNVYIMYDDPKREDGFWYPSVIELDVEDYKFTVKVEKLFINPTLDENDFKIPLQS